MTSREMTASRSESTDEWFQRRLLGFVLVIVLVVFCSCNVCLLICLIIKQQQQQTSRHIF